MKPEFIVITRDGGSPMSQEEKDKHSLELGAEFIEERPKMNWNADISPPGMHVTLEYVFKKTLTT